MKTLLFSAFFLLRFIPCYAQQLNKDTSKYKNAPIYILRQPNQPDIQASNLDIDVKKIDSLNVLTKDAAIKLYGVEGKNRVMFLYVNPTVKLLSLNDILDKYGIAVKNRELPVYIDSVIALHPSKLYFESNAVKTVKIEKENLTDNKYISILFIHPHLKPKPGEVFVW
ncbi:MAG: hypothetical protein JWQ79_157 [Mucilaginibacter sp.]|jgi:hypothetical protein|nr:hypothetical protein [Mucilaginibacter sp.]